MNVRIIGRRAYASFVLSWLVLGWSGSALADAVAESPRANRMSRDELHAIAPYLAQLVNISMLDPALAASMVPESWIESLLDGALAIEAEVPAAAGAADPPARWPIGPWPSPASLAASIRELQPAAVASLYAALRPRLGVRCRERKLSIEACEGAIRSTVSRLSSKKVAARALGKPVQAITPTQRELARLGEPVVTAARQQLRGVGTTLWGAPQKPVQ